MRRSEARPPEVAAANAAALLSFWLDDLDDRTAAEKEMALLGGRHSGFLVDQAIPRDYDRRTWPDGARTPGAKLLSLFPKPARLSDEQFFGHWFGSHTPLSLEVHPLWRYVRNVASRPLTPAAPPYRGIVEEQCRALEDLTDPMRFFGGVENLSRVLADVRAFLDIDSVENSVMSEYILRS